MNDQQTDIVQTSAEQSVHPENNSVMAVSSEEKNNEKKNNNKIYVIIAVILFILIIGELGFVFLYHNSAFKQLLPSFLIKSTPTATTNVQDGGMIPAPTGQYANGTGVASGFKVQLEQILKNPKVIGGSLNKNFEYLEVDVSVTNNTKQMSLVPGKFFFQDATGKFSPTTDIFIKYPNNMEYLSNKNVIIPRKSSLYAERINPGQTINELYLLYQIPSGESGNIIWFDANDPLKSKKIATFTIN